MDLDKENINMTKISIKQIRCSNHISREAVARCPKCEKDYCRECVTEYKEQMLCINCLSVASEEIALKPSYMGLIILTIIFIISFIIMWLIFYWLGEFFSGADTFHNQLRF